MTDWPKDAPKGDDIWYKCFESWHKKEEIPDLFLNMFGHLPRKVFKSKGIWWAGPIKKGVMPIGQVQYESLQSGE